MDYLFLFSPKGEPMLNLKGKGRPRGEEPHFGGENRITAAASAVKPEKKKKTLIQQLLTAERKEDQQGLIRAKRWT